MHKLLYIARRTALAVLLLLLALVPAMAQLVVYQGETTTLAVVEVPGETYEWEIYSDGTVDFAKVPGNCPVTSANFVGSNAGASVSVKWYKPGIYYYKVTVRDIAGCTNNIKIGMLEVKEALPVATFTPPSPSDICVGQTASLEVNITGTGPWNLTYTDGVTYWTVKDITEPKSIVRVSPLLTTSYWITEVSNENGTNSVPSEKITLVVQPKPVSSRIYQYEP